MDIYADDLTIYLEFDKLRMRRNRENIRKALNVIPEFYEWSGLSVNVGKTHMAVFGIKHRRIDFVDELGIKWCTYLKCFGIEFDVTLTNMESNFEKCFEAIKKRA